MFSEVFFTASTALNERADVIASGFGVEIQRMKDNIPRCSQLFDLLPPQNKDTLLPDCELGNVAPMHVAARREKEDELLHGQATFDTFDVQQSFPPIGIVLADWARRGIGRLNGNDLSGYDEVGGLRSLEYVFIGETLDRLGNCRNLGLLAGAIRGKRHPSGFLHDDAVPINQTVGEEDSLLPDSYAGTTTQLDRDALTGEVA
jgi:hypothetical protein